MMITGNGDSASTLKTQVSARNCFNGYAALNGMESLMNTARETFCDEAFFQKFAYYLTSVYKTTEDGFLRKSTALGYIGCILVIGQNTLFKGISNIRYPLLKDRRLIFSTVVGDPFFKDLDVVGNWYTKMRCGIERKIVKRYESSGFEI
jgi:hypothetical protein